MSWTLIILVCWIVIGVFNYGMTFGHFQNNYPSLADIMRTEDIVFSIFCAILGPIMLLVFLIIKSLEPWSGSSELRLENIKFY